MIRRGEVSCGEEGKKKKKKKKEGEKNKLLSRVWHFCHEIHQVVTNIHLPLRYVVSRFYSMNLLFSIHIQNNWI